jgi:hypothetical protein
MTGELIILVSLPRERPEDFFPFIDFLRPRFRYPSRAVGIATAKCGAGSEECQFMTCLGDCQVGQIQD